MGWDGGGRDGAPKIDYTREAMVRRRAGRWRAFAQGVPEGWTGEAIHGAGVWARSSILTMFRGVAGRAALCGGGGDEANLDDEAPSGTYPQARACAEAAGVIPQPGQVEVFAALLSGLRPCEVIAFADAVERGHPNGLDLTTGEVPSGGKRSWERLAGRSK